MLMVIAPFMSLEFIYSTVPFLAELAIERLAGFAGGLRLQTPSGTGILRTDRIKEIMKQPRNREA